MQQGAREEKRQTNKAGEHFEHCACAGCQQYRKRQRDEKIGQPVE
jgi:hypothetical protein